MRIYIGDKKYSALNNIEKLKAKMLLNQLSTVQKIMILEKGQTAQINTKRDNTVNWTSQNPNVASVNATGLVTGKEAGEAVITASLYNDTKQSSQCLIKVKDKDFAKEINESYKTPYGFLSYLNPVNMVNVQIAIEGRFYNYDLNNVNTLSLGMDQKDIITNIKEGTNAVRISHDTAGEFEIALNIIDCNSKSSEQMIKRYKVIEFIPTNQEKDIVQSDDISDTINSVIVEGGNYLKLNKSSYKISAPIIIPDNFTLDLNSSVISISGDNNKQCAFILNGDNSSVINGTIESAMPEAQAIAENGAIIFGKNSRYCSVKNINFKSIPCYAIQDGQRLYNSTIINNKIIFHIYSEENIGRAISDYIDIENYSKNNLYLGCFDGGMGLHSYNIFKCYEYDKDKKPIRNAVYKIYSRLSLQGGTRYIKIELFDDDIPRSYSLENIDVSYNNIISDCSFDDCTLGAININMMENGLIKNCTATNCGSAITAKYGFDMINGLMVNGLKSSGSSKYDIDIEAGSVYEIKNCTAENIYISQKARYVIIDDDNDISCVTQEKNNTIIESHNFI